MNTSLECESLSLLQAQAMDCACAGLDCVVGLSSQGSESVCFQVPAITRRGMAVIVSPSVSRTKRELEFLAARHIQADRLDSSLDFVKQADVVNRVRRGSLNILFITPERMLDRRLPEFFSEVEISFFAMLEADRVSVWGRGFRPEYRELGCLRELFPGKGIHAFASMATEQVLRDISTQLGLENPTIIRESPDRPNLTYTVEESPDTLRRICSVIDRYKGQPGIIFCTSDEDVACVYRRLSGMGHRVWRSDPKSGAEPPIVEHEHPAMVDADVFVATHESGFSSNKVNLRYVIHAGMPKSMEQYSRECFQAGGDGLEAESLLLYSAGDYGTWKSTLLETRLPAGEIALVKLNEMYGYCLEDSCRRNAILDYFGQDPTEGNCAGCDVCLDRSREAQTGES